MDMYVIVMLLCVMMCETAKYLRVAACFACCGMVARRKHLVGVWALICAPSVLFVGERVPVLTNVEPGQISRGN